MRKKTIGIILRKWKADFREIPLYGLKDDMIKFLRQYNVNIICIPVDFENENELEIIKETQELCDGVIFPGGEGIYEIDCEIMRYLHEINKPTLGICLGMQIMGKSFNGNVIPEGAIQIGKCHDAPYEEYVHTIKIEKDTLLYDIIGEEEIEVNSRHTDCVEYTDLECTARSNRGVMEAVEDKTKKFFLGVQWHPESMKEDKYSKKIFDKFVSCL